MKPELAILGKQTQSKNCKQTLSQMMMRNKNSTAGGVFPCKLHDMIDYAERNNLDDIIAWTPSGRSFIVHSPNRLVHQLLPLFFGLTKYRSFRRQLNIWSFETIHQNGSDNSIGGSTNSKSNANRRLMFQHPYFIRGKRSICENMGRETFKRVPNNKTSSGDNSSSRRNSDASTTSTSQDQQLLRTPTATSTTLSFASNSGNAQPTCNKVSLDDIGGRNQLPQPMDNISGGHQLNKTWSNNMMFMNGRINSAGSSPSSPSSSVLYTPTNMQNSPMMMMSSECNSTPNQQVHPTLPIHPQFSLQNMMFSMNNNNTVNDNSSRISQSKLMGMGSVAGTGMTKNGYPDKVSSSSNNNFHSNSYNHNDGDIAEFAGRSFHFVEIED